MSKSDGVKFFTKSQSYHHLINLDVLRGLTVIYSYSRIVSTVNLSRDYELIVFCTLPMLLVNFYYPFV